MARRNADQMEVDENGHRGRPMMRRSYTCCYCDREITSQEKWEEVKEEGIDILLHQQCKKTWTVRWLVWGCYFRFEKQWLMLADANLMPADALPMLSGASLVLMNASLMLASASPMASY
jgi:hypothetical protein